MKRMKAGLAAVTSTVAASALVAAVVLGSAVGTAQAAPLDASSVAAGAKWVVHVDFDAARDSKVGQHIREKALADEHVKKALAKLQDEFGFDPEKDLHGATLYGTDFTPHTGVLIVYAVADKDKVMSHLKSKKDFITLKTDDGQHELYTWTEHMGHGNGGHGNGGHGNGDHKHTVWAAFPKHGVGVFADSAGDLKAALDVLGGKGGLATDSSLLPNAPKGTVFSGAVAGLSAVKLPTRLPMAKQVDSISFAAGESDGEDFDHIKVGMTNGDTAKQVKSIIDGVQAMAALRLGDHPEALKMVNALKASADGKTLSIDWKASSDDVIKFAEKACEFMKQHHQERPRGRADGKRRER